MQEQNTVKVTDVLVGEVWVGLGQSNMEIVLKDVLRTTKEIADSANLSLRYFTMAKVAPLQLADNVKEFWD